MNTFMDLMVKDVTTLHKVLSRFLPSTSMRVGLMATKDNDIDSSSSCVCCNDVLLTQYNYPFATYRKSLTKCFRYSPQDLRRRSRSCPSRHLLGRPGTLALIQLTDRERLRRSSSVSSLTRPHPIWNRLQADMAYFGQKLGPFDPNGIIGSRLMKQVKELDLSDRRRSAGAAATAGTSASGQSASNMQQ